VERSRFSRVLFPEGKSQKVWLSILRSYLSDTRPTKLLALRRPEISAGHTKESGRERVRRHPNVSMPGDPSRVCHELASGMVSSGGSGETVLAVRGR
jgi:hypothetical protein